MRVLHIDRYGSVKGGAESYLYALADAQQARGDTVGVAYSFEPDQEREVIRSGFHVPAITSHDAEPSDSERAELVHAVDTFGPDVIHVHNIEATWLPALLAERYPLVFGVHDHRVSCPTGTRYWAAWRRSCGIKPGIVCLGYNAVAHCGSFRANATLKPFLEWKRWNAAAKSVKRIQVFSDFMASSLALSGIARDGVRVTPYPVPPMVAPAVLPDEGGRPVVFAIGRLVKEKGFDTVIASLDHMRSSVLLVIGGTGHHAEALKAKAAKAYRKHEVRFVGWLPPDQMSAWYQRADVVAVPSAWPEPFGIVGLEAMASGRAVVASNVGGIGQWLRDGETGLLVPPGDARALAEALDRLLSDAPERQRMGRAGLARANAEFALDAHAAVVEQMYKEIA